jgi:hypothetical protein
MSSRIDELRLQLTHGEIQADHPALSQALVINVGVRYTISRLLAFARFALFQARFVWHDPVVL